MIGFKFNQDTGLHEYKDLEAKTIGGIHTGINVTELNAKYVENSRALYLSKECEDRRLTITQSPYSRVVNYINSLTEEQCDKLIEKMEELVNAD